VRAATIILAASALLLCGCADRVPPRTQPPPLPAVPCLSQADDVLFATCLRTELDEVWRARFDATARGYTSPQLTVGNTPGPGTEHRAEAHPDRAYFNSRTGIHLPTGYLDDVRAAHGARVHVVLSFTMAHEVGHHVQHLLHRGIHAPIVDVETQADCYAGVWAHQEAGAGALDAEEFRAGAAAELRRLSADPDEVRTHSDADQRVASLDKGLRTGDPEACDVGGLTWRPPAGPG
jgi:predicted metalloprotease